MHPEHPAGWDRIWEGRWLVLARFTPKYVICEPGRGQAIAPPIFGACSPIIADVGY